MGDLISRSALLESLIYCEDLKGRRTTEVVAKLINDAPAVDALPRSYADQIRWERDIAIEQLNEIGCQFGQKMDDVKTKIEKAHGKWIGVEYDMFFECSNCGYLTDYHLTNFCPKCGAKMDGKEKKHGKND